MSVCSCNPATTLDSRDESLTGFVQQSLGDLEADTRNWNRSPSGRGRFQYLQGDDKGTIEVIEWKELVRDAKIRNQNFLEAARLSFTQKGESVFDSTAGSKSQAAE